SFRCTDLSTSNIQRQPAPCSKSKLIEPHQNLPAGSHFPSFILLVEGSSRDASKEVRPSSSTAEILPGRAAIKPPPLVALRLTTVPTCSVRVTLESLSSFGSNV